MIYDDLLRRIDDRLKALGLSERAACLKAELKVDAIRNIRRGRAPRAETLTALARALDLPPTALLDGPATPAPAPMPPAPDLDDGFEPAIIDLPAPAAMPLNVPVYGVCEGGSDGAFEMNGSVIDFVRRPPGILHAKNVYAVYVVGTSMEPRFEPGDLLYVSPNKPAQPGCDVVIQMVGETEDSPRRCYVKRLVRRSPSAVRVRQYNPDKEYELNGREVLAIHRVLTAAELLGI